MCAGKSRLESPRGPRARAWSRRGFTLLELVVVMVILALLAGAVTLMVVRRVGEARTERARLDVENFGNALEHYRLDNQDYPSGDQGLEALVTRPSTPPEPPNWTARYIKSVPNDPWGRAYHYKYPGTVNQEGYDLWSWGKDGKEGGVGEDADVNNWREQKAPEPVRAEGG